MKKALRVVSLLLCLLLCGCGQSKIQAVKGTGSAPDRTTAVQQDNDTETGSGISEEGYQEEYYTSEETAVAEIIQAGDTSSAEKEADADETLQAAVLEYAGCLYPAHTAANAAVSSRNINGTNYLFFAVTDDVDTLFCTIAYDEQANVFYLYDSEVQQLIPIEYDEYGVRLVG